jgi:surface protein
LITGSVAVAVTCGKGYCRDQKNSVVNDLAAADPSEPPSVQPSVLNSILETDFPTLSPTLTPRQAFQTTEELYVAVDAYLADDFQPVVKEITNRYGHPIGTWRVELLTNFTSVFDAKRNPATAQWIFDDSLSDWNTSRATTMRNMFHGTRNFNGDLSQWDTSQVVDMRGMFQDCIKFEGTGLANWKTGRVLDFRDFLGRATSFRGDLGQWDVSSATNMHGMCKCVVMSLDCSFFMIVGIGNPFVISCCHLGCAQFDRCEILIQTFRTGRLERSSR